VVCGPARVRARVGPATWVPRVSRWAPCGSGAREPRGVLRQGQMEQFESEEEMEEGEGEDAEEEREVDSVAATARAVSVQPHAPPRSVDTVAAPPDAVPEPGSPSAVKDKLEQALQKQMDLQQQLRDTLEVCATLLVRNNLCNCMISILVTLHSGLQILLMEEGFSEISLRRPSFCPGFCPPLLFPHVLGGGGDCWGAFN
jgi:hypothetical protein